VPPSGAAGAVQPMAQRSPCVATGVLPGSAPGALSPNQSMLNLVGAWKYSRGDGQLVAVIDTGDGTAQRRGAEIGAAAILKGTHSGVDGVYTADPRTNPEAVRYDRITYIDVINQGLKIMDSTAITFCRDNKLPIVVFDVLKPGNIHRVLTGEQIGTLVD